MKKVYVNPKIEVVKIAASSQMLTVSNPEFDPSGTTSTMEGHGTDDDFEW